MQIRLQTCLIERVGSYNAKLLCRLVDRYAAGSMHLNKARHVLPQYLRRAWALGAV